MREPVNFTGNAFLSALLLFVLLVCPCLEAEIFYLNANLEAAVATFVEC